MLVLLEGEGELERDAQRMAGDDPATHRAGHFAPLFEMIDFHVPGLVVGHRDIVEEHEMIGATLDGFAARPQIDQAREMAIAAERCADILVLEHKTGGG